MLRKCIFVLTAVVAAVIVMAPVEGRRVLLRPIPASEVYRILRAAGREDAVPEGRVITHGLAALNGLALGFKKGVLGVALADGLAAWANSNNSSSSSSGNAPSFSYNGTSNELCFTSRSATSDILASGEGREAGDEDDNGTAGTTTGAATSDADSPDDDVEQDQRATTTGTGSSPVVTNTGTNTGSGTNTLTNTMSTTQTTAPTTNCIVINKG